MAFTDEEASDIGADETGGAGNQNIQDGQRYLPRIPRSLWSRMSSLYSASLPTGSSTTAAALFPVGCTISRRVWKGRSVARWPMLNSVVSGSRSRTSW